METPHMTIAETALYMRKSKRHIEALVADGSLPSSKDGRRRTVHRNDADNYLRKCRQSGTTVGGAA